MAFPIEFVNVCIPCFWITKRKPTSEKNSNVLFFFTRQTTFNWGWNKCPRQHLVHSRTLTSSKLPIIKFIGFKNCLVLFFKAVDETIFRWYFFLLGLKIVRISWHFSSKKCWKFQLSIWTNKKALFLKNTSWAKSLNRPG